MRSFLGLVNFSVWFIPNLSTVAEPLHQLTRKNTVFKFGEAEKKSFEVLKEAVTSATTLGFYDLNAKKIRVIADASPVGLGVVLVPEEEDRYRVLAYANRSLSDVECQYSQTEKEALALVWACEKLHPYIYGIDFELVTDHKLLQTIFSPRSKPCARIEHWVLWMQPYAFKVGYAPGRQNIADPLSRLMADESPGQGNLGKLAADYVRFVAMTAMPSTLTTQEVEKASRRQRAVCSPWMYPEWKLG